MNKKFKVKNIIILILVVIIGSGFAYEYYMRSSSRLKSLLEDNLSDFQAASAVLSDNSDTSGTVSDLIEITAEILRYAIFLQDFRTMPGSLQ